MYYFKKLYFLISHFEFVPFLLALFLLRDSTTNTYYSIFTQFFLQSFDVIITSLFFSFICINNSEVWF